MNGKSITRGLVLRRLLIGFVTLAGLNVIALAQDRQDPAPSRPARPMPQPPADDERGQATQQERAQEQAPPPIQPPVRSAQQDERVAAQNRIAEALDKLPPEMLARIQGADVSVEMIGDQLIIRGPEEAVQVLELLIRGLDVEREPKVLEVVTVTERDANEIARTVQEAVNRAFETPNRRPEDEVMITALSSNVLMVAAIPSEIDFVVDVIKQVDEVPDPLGKIELMKFQVKNRRASEVARQLEDFIRRYREARGARDESKIQVFPQNADNTIIVTARESERETIENILSTLDVEPVSGFGELELTIFPLLHSDAEQLATVIEELLRAQLDTQGGGGGGARAGGAAGAVEEFIQRLRISKATPDGQLIELPPIDLQKPMRIQPDQGTNSLIIATAKENVEPMSELIKLLDGVPMAADVTVRLFPLRFAAADKVEETLNSMFDAGKELPPDPDGSGDDGVPESPVGKALVYNIGIISDVRTNTVIVSGRPEQLGLAAEIIDKLDQPSTAYKFPLRLLRLEYADATQFSETLTRLFEQRMEMYQAMEFTGAALERERVFLSVDIPTNSLIVSASEENFTEITDIAKQLDTKPAMLFGQIRIVGPLERLSAADLKTKIDELWKRKGQLRSQAEIPEDLPIVVADERSNSLVVASSLEDYEEIVRLVDSLQSRPFVGDTRLFALKQADANVLAGMLDQLFEGIAGQSETFEAPTIIPDRRSNTLIVAASQDAMERVDDLIERLDVEAGPMTSIFKVYPLSHASAGNLAPRIDELFQARQEGADAGGQATPVVVLPDEASNSLVVSASRDDHAILIGLLELLDRPSTLARNVRIFPLRLAKATNVAETLDALFQSQAEGGGGRADAIATEADERTNSVIVWASPSQMSNVAEVIERLDTATPTRETMVRVIQLKQALAEDFATLLDETLGGGQGEGAQEATILSFVEEMPDGERRVRKLLRQDIKVQADPRTNSLMVVAPSDSMDMLETMIRDFDRIKPITSEIRLFPLMNADAQTMVDRLTEIFEAETVGGGDGGTEIRQQLTFGDAEVGEATVGQELRFAADTRTNTLIAAGAPSYLRMVEDIVHFLDSQEVENRITEVYPAKFRDATELADAIKNFVQQETDILGEGQDEESRMRRMERQISVEAIGDPEEGSSTLLIGTDRRAYQRTMELIQGLDRPEPQVMISVLIAEVTLSDDVELGVEIAGQDLTFSENATVGPNGIINGTDFDVVGGSSLGAGGPLGFSFTVTGEDFNFLFHAFQRDSRLEVLSRPVLLVRNGEEGNITIADAVPVITSQQVTDSGQVNVTPGREDVGVILTATPHISPDGYVTIEIEQEVSNLGEEIQLTETVSQPIFSKRNVTTNVTVRDGETVAIGGLIQSSHNEGETKVPILGDLPGLGWLFRNTIAGSNKTELLLVLTVDILRTDEDVRRMSVEQRDKFMLPPTVLKSPLMEGLRIRPEEEGLGPRPAIQPLRPNERLLPPDAQFGPQPKTYGPKIEPPATPTSADSRPVYGPKIVRNTPTAKLEEDDFLKSLQP